MNYSSCNWTNNHFPSLKHKGQSSFRKTQLQPKQFSHLFPQDLGKVANRRWTDSASTHDGHFPLSKNIHHKDTTQNKKSCTSMHWYWLSSISIKFLLKTGPKDHYAAKSSHIVANQSSTVLSSEKDLETANLKVYFQPMHPAKNLLTWANLSSKLDMKTSFTGIIRLQSPAYLYGESSM